MKCCICNSKKGKRVCLINNNLEICSSCCGQMISSKTCFSCHYFKDSTSLKKSNNHPTTIIPSESPKCGLCGSTTKRLTKTPCCDNWICDDEDSYQLFSFAHNSCSRNHRRYTLCSFHYNEGHTNEDWKTCNDCKDSFEPAVYYNFGTSDYNFEKLPNPKKVEIKCAHCNFTSYSMDDFAYRTNEGHVCPKKTCVSNVFGKR